MLCSHGPTSTSWQDAFVFPPVTQIPSSGPLAEAKCCWASPACGYFPKVTVLLELLADLEMQHSFLFVCLSCSWEKNHPVIQDFQKGWLESTSEPITSTHFMCDMIKWYLQFCFLIIIVLDSLYPIYDINISLYTSLNIDCHLLFFYCCIFGSPEHFNCIKCFEHICYFCRAEQWYLWIFIKSLFNWFGSMALEIITQTFFSGLHV